MNYSITQILALIFIAIASIKILVLLINPNSWSRLIKKVWKKSTVTMIVCLVLAAAVLYLLLLEGITIVQIIAVMTFISLLAGAGIAMYAQDMVVLSHRLLRDRNLVKKSWLYILIWVVLMLFALKEIFM